MKTFDRGVDIETADDRTLARELEMTLDYIARGPYLDKSVDPRQPTVRAIIIEQERRKVRQ